MPGDIKELHRILDEDTKFCLKHNIMDYSLLLAVEKFTSNAYSVDKSLLPDIVAINKEDSSSSEDDDSVEQQVSLKQPSMISQMNKSKRESKFYHMASDNRDTFNSREKVNSYM